MPPLTIKIQALKVSEMYVRLYGIAQMRAEAMHKRMGQSARADCVVGAKYYSQCAVPDRDWKAFVAHVNARSSNHDPNHVLNHVPKRLSERDSSPCKHTLHVHVCACTHVCTALAMGMGTDEGRKF